MTCALIVGKVTPNVDKTEVIARDELHLVGVWRGVPVVMFEGYRNGVFALGLIIGVGIATASILWVFGLNYCPNQPCRYSSAADDPSGDHGRVWQFPSAMRGTFSYPLEPDLAEGRPKRYEYYDLRAQERMAHATDWIAWLTLISSVISVFGLVALLFSLAQTKRAISDTREIGEAQVRAYLDITDIEISKIFHDRPSIRINVQNTGQSPAVKMVLHFQIKMTEGETLVGEKWEGGTDVIYKDFSKPITVMDLPSGFDDWIGPFAPHFDDMELAVSVWQNENNFLTVQVRLDAEDVFGKPIKAHVPFTGIAKIGDGNYIRGLHRHQTFDGTWGA